MGKKAYILFVLLWIGVIVTPLLAKSTKASSLTIEEQQQFLYYLYEAQRLIQKEAIEPAWELVQFCYALNPHDATINNYMGVFLDAAGKQEEAAEYFQRAYKLQPSEYWYQYALYLLQSNDKKKEKTAIRNLEQVAKNNPKNEDVHNMLQKAYIHVGDYKHALAIQDRLDSIIGYNAISAMQRYRLNAMLSNNQQAVYEVERYLEEDPDNMQFQVFRAQLYEETHQSSEKMVVAYTALLRFDPHNLMLMNNLAWHMCLAGIDLNKAEELSRTTIMAAPSNPIYLDTYAWIMYHKGDYETAFFYIQRALENSTPEDKVEITAHYNAILKKLEL